MVPTSRPLAVSRPHNRPAVVAGLGALGAGMAGEGHAGQRGAAGDDLADLLCRLFGQGAFGVAARQIALFRRIETHQPIAHAASAHGVAIDHGDAERQDIA